MSACVCADCSRKVCPNCVYCVHACACVCVCVYLCSWVCAGVAVCVCRVVLRCLVCRCDTCLIARALNVCCCVCVCVCVCVCQIRSGRPKSERCLARGPPPPWDSRPTPRDSWPPSLVTRSSSHRYIGHKHSTSVSTRCNVILFQFVSRDSVVNK